LATVAGDSAYAVAISTTYTGAAGSETPTGEIIYLLATDIDYKLISMDPFTQSAGFTIRYPTNMRKISVGLVGCTIPKQGAVKSTTEASAIINFVYNYSIKFGAAKLYCFLYHMADELYLKCSWNTSHVQLQYIKGQFENLALKLGGGEYPWKAPTITFTEATTP